MNTCYTFVSSPTIESIGHCVLTKDGSPIATVLYPGHFGVFWPKKVQQLFDRILALHTEQQTRSASHVTHM